VKLPKRAVYALLIALVCANVMFRLPTTHHETGIDSFFVHNLATAISQEGRIPWVINALGYFGWYPLSYPSGAPVLISGVALTSGVSEEAAILLLAILYGALGVLGGFLMGRTFRTDDVFALLVATVFSLAPRFVTSTLWSASARNLFMVLIPFFLWAIVRANRRPTVPNAFLLVSATMLMVAAHRLTILLAVVVIAFVVAFVFLLLYRVTRIRFPRLLLSRSVRRGIPWLILLAIIGITAFLLVETGVLGEYSSGQICSGTSAPDELCNLGVSLTRSVGLALPLAFVGVLEIVRVTHKGFLEAFLILSLLALIPTLFLRQYTGFYILPFLALASAFGIVSLANVFAKHRRARQAVLMGSVLVLSGFSYVVLQYEVRRLYEISDSTYTTALFLKALPGGNFVSNNGLVTVRLAALSGRQGLPIGGAGTTDQSPELLVMGAYNAASVGPREQRIPLTDITIEDDSPFYLTGIDARTDWVVKVMREDVANVSPQVRDQYSLQFFVESRDYLGGYFAFDNFYHVGAETNFALSVHATRYKLLAGPTEDVYLAFPPETG